MIYFGRSLVSAHVSVSARLWRFDHPSTGPPSPLVSPPGASLSFVLFVLFPSGLSLSFYSRMVCLGTSVLDFRWITSASSWQT